LIFRETKLESKWTVDKTAWFILSSK